MSVNAPTPTLLPAAPVPTLDHERLEVYQRALEFHTLVLTLLPPRGFRALRDQIERASLGAVLCIAEGAGRTSRTDKRRFYEMARGSMTESAAVLDVMRVRSLLTPDQHRMARELAVRLVQMLSRLCGPPRW